MVEKAPTLGELDVQESAADTMRSVMADIGFDSDEPAKSGTNEEPLADAKPVATDTESAGDKARARDEKGRFAKGEDGVLPDEKPIAAVEPGAASDKPTVPDPAEADAYLEPPPEWVLAAQEDFRKLPTEARKLVLHHSAAAQQAINEARQLTGRFQSVDQILAPRREAFARDGLDDAGFLRQLFAISDFATKDKPGFIKWFMQANQVPPESVFGQPQAQGQDTYVDPEIAELRQNYQALQQRQAQTERALKQRDDAIEKAGLRDVGSEVENFRRAADDKGRAQHPYFEQVRPLMQGLLQSEQATDLRTAYDMACRAHPEVSAKIAAAARAADEQERARKNREKAQAAGKAGSSITGTPGDRAMPAPSDDIREDMRRQFIERGIAL